MTREPSGLFFSRMAHFSRIHPNLFLYLTVFINIAGFSMVFPMLPFYAQEFNATAWQIGLLAASHAIANFFVSPVVGRISDRIGRRPVLIAGLLFGSCSMLVLGFAQSLAMLFLGRIFHGMIAGAIMPTARAYMGDVSPPKERVRAMGKIGAATSAGLLLGPGISSILIGAGDIRLPFFVAAAVAFCNAIFVTMILPESLVEKTKRLVVREGFLNFTRLAGYLGGSQGILFVILFLWAFAMTNKQVTFVLFVGERFRLGAQHIGFFFSGLALISIVVQGYLLPKIVDRMGEKWTLSIGLGLMGLSLVALPFAPSIAILLIPYILLGIGSALNRPTTEGLLSSTTTTGQGTTLGVSQSFESLGRVLGPIVGGFLYGQVSPASPFVFAGLLLFIIAPVVWRVLNIPPLKSSALKITLTP